jgi:hypothetical protein
VEDSRFVENCNMLLSLARSLLVQVAATCGSCQGMLLMHGSSLQAANGSCDVFDRLYDTQDGVCVKRSSRQFVNDAASCACWAAHILSTHS